MTERARKILVVDDSVNTGHEMQPSRDLIAASKTKHDCLFAAAYVRGRSAGLVDISFEICETPRLFEWNLLHHSYLEYAMLDIDGVLCVDPMEEENDDGPRYLRFLEGASSLLLPTVPVGAVTCRLESTAVPPSGGCWIGASSTATWSCGTCQARRSGYRMAGMGSTKVRFFANTRGQDCLSRAPRSSSRDRGRIKKAGSLH